VGTALGRKLGALRKKQNASRETLSADDAGELTGGILMFKGAAGHRKSGESALTGPYNSSCRQPQVAPAAVDVWPLRTELRCALETRNIRYIVANQQLNP